jgi:hypothetical protein
MPRRQKNYIRKQPAFNIHTRIADLEHAIQRIQAALQNEKDSQELANLKRQLEQNERELKDAQQNSIKR